MGKVDEQSNNFNIVNEKLDKYYKDIEEENFEEDYDKYENASYILGASGCGICSLKKLKDSGVTHLKVVGRGNSIDNMERDILGLRKAIDVLSMTEQTSSIQNNEYILENDTSFEQKIKDKIFCGKCSDECYY